MAAGLATLELLDEPGFYARLEQKTRTLTAGLEAAARDAGVAFTTNRVGGMFGLFFTNARPVTRYAQVLAGDLKRFQAFSS